MAEKIPTIKTVTKKAALLYNKTFGEEPRFFAFAPGRVNLIGEHTDYNDGFVMPIALPLICLWAGKRYDGVTAEIYSAAPGIEEPRFSFNINNLNHTGPQWVQYIKGVMANYHGTLRAFKAVILSTVPVGKGLSSSAALEVSTYMFLDELNGGYSNITPLEKAMLCQKAEHKYAGVPCGIMDQYVAFMGKVGHALLIDCRSLTSKLIPFNDSDLVVMIIDSNVKHELSGSEYSNRREECEKAAELLGKKSLRDADAFEFNKLMATGKAKADVLRRARHVISEIRRTEEAAKLLMKGKYDWFGMLMLESHKSLKNDFRVSCPELDQLVELTMQCRGVLGTRMTGAGFGGCTVSILSKDVIDIVIKHVKKNFEGDPKFYIVRPCDGTSRLCGCASYV